MSNSVRRVVVTGAGVVSCLGDSTGEMHAALCDGRSGLGPVDLFASEQISARQAGEIRDFDPALYVGAGNLRPLDRTARLAVAAAANSLSDSGWNEEALAENEVGLVLGTLFGSVRTISEFDRRAISAGPLYAKPMDFANSVINAAAGQAGIWHRLRSLNATMTGGPTAGLQAIAYAADQIRQGRAAAILAGGADELCFESLLGFERAGLLCGSQNGGSGAPRPFDTRRQGFVLAEGAALLMLEDGDAAEARGAKVLGEVLGHGNSYDPSRGDDDDSAVRAARHTMELALEGSGVRREGIHAISASASGSVAGDRHEALALAAVFGEDDTAPPVTAVKSMLGEAPGASGALQAASLLESLQGGILPGIRGLEEAEPGAPSSLSSTSREVEAKVALVNAFGFDGNHVSLVLSRARNGAGIAA